MHSSKNGKFHAHIFDCFNPLAVSSLVSKSLLKDEAVQMSIKMISSKILSFIYFNVAVHLVVFQNESKHCQINMFPSSSISSHTRCARSLSPVIVGSSLSLSSHGMHIPDFSLVFGCPDMP